MVQTRSRLRFLEQTLTSLTVYGHACRKEFKSGFTAKSQVLGTVHCAHSTFAEFGQDAVMRNGLSNQVERSTGSRKC